MVELGKDMVKQCAGVPLAIVALGGILATKSSLNDWQRVHDNVKSYLTRAKGWGIHAALALSYEDLPAYLKPCFQYLGIFPEDFEIPVVKLIQLWVAEDLVSAGQDEGDGEEMVEDVAEHYLEELVERYMVQVGKRDASLKIKTCRMHYLVRDFCLSKVKEENFLDIIGRPHTEPTDVSTWSSAIGKVRRLAMHKSVSINCIKNPQLRSVFFFDKTIFPPELIFKSQHYQYFDSVTQSDDRIHNLRGFISGFWVLCVGKHNTRGVLKYIFSNFKLLRVLDLENTGSIMGCKLLSDIGYLVHLRYLSLGDACVARLPSSLSKLRWLQTLDLRVAEGGPFPVHVPNVIWRLERLKHLYLPQKCRRKPKLELGNLVNLQTLVNFNTRNCYLGDISNMKNLRVLGICRFLIIEDFKEDLNMNPPIITSKHLRSLSISSDKSIDPSHLTYLLSSCVNLYELDLSVEIRKFPEPQHISSNIAYICLARSKLDEDPMPTLQKLPKLRTLELKEEAFIGEVMVFSAQGFPLLDSLSIISQSNLEELRVSEGAMPNLHHLRIAKCRNLKMLPDELRFITTLKELKIEEMPKAFKDRLVEGGEDFYKVQHVPSIIFQNCDD